MLIHAIQLFSQISEIYFQKAIGQYITFNTAVLYLRKKKQQQFLWTSTRKLGTHFSYLALLAENHQTFTQNNVTTSILIIVT